MKEFEVRVKSKGVRLTENGRECRGFCLLHTEQFCMVNQKKV